VVSAVIVKPVPADTRVALLVAVTEGLDGAAGPALAQEYVMTPRAPALELQPLPRLGKVYPAIPALASLELAVAVNEPLVAFDR
jgi:hypothetical protein